MVELLFEDNIYQSKSLEHRISDPYPGLKSMTIAGQAQPSFKLRRAHLIDNDGVEHELITEKELERGRSLHLFFQEDPGPGQK